MMAILQLDKRNQVPSQAHEGTATLYLRCLNVDSDYKQCSCYSPFCAYG